MKKNWRLIFIVILFVAALITWRWFAHDLGAGLTALLGIIGLGGEALIRGVKKRAKKKADGLYSDADILADINRRKRRKR